MITPKKLARMLQNRSASIKAAQYVSALRQDMTNSTGTCFYVGDDEGGILRVTVIQFKEPI